MTYVVSFVALFGSIVLFYAFAMVKKLGISERTRVLTIGTNILWVLTVLSVLPWTAPFIRVMIEGTTYLAISIIVTFALAFNSFLWYKFLECERCKTWKHLKKEPEPFGMI